MKKIILNQKSYLLYDEMVEFKKEFDKIKLNDYEFILFPQVCYLSMFNNAKYPVGAQNFYRTKTASFTGEINLQTLSSMNINYTLIGHYERKKLIGETKEFTKEKLFRSLNSKFNTILCVGETKKTNRPFLYIKKDLTYYLKSIEKKNLKYLSIVYEPNWAIGTGEIQCTDKILKTIDQIKQEVENSSQEQKELQSQIKEDLSESSLTIAEQIEKLKSKIAELSQTEQNITQVCESLVEKQPAAIEEVGNQETQPLVEGAAEQADCAEVCLAEQTLATVQTTEVEAKEEVSTETFVISLGEEELDFSSFSTQQIKELVLKLLERL